ncbi:MAG TPA: hypothetical protein DDW52_05395 [Planctomycetaceae bacterium]|nr:hypothetical protein [Planctomycetaceae bacterium]
MHDGPLKERITERLWQVVDADANICSATLTGSFLNSETLDGLSDIDFVVITEELSQSSFNSLTRQFSEAVADVVASEGMTFLLNPTLGPLKFNEPNLVVLHLMLYSREAHKMHVIQSPFTCLDWQRSECYRKDSMESVYPTFGLQPHHFHSARRSISDYLRDYRTRVVSFRELACTEVGYSEVRREKPMDDRDRHEFAYHVIRFLMLNLLKLIRRESKCHQDLTVLARDYATAFPIGAESATQLLFQLADKKRRLDYAASIEGLDKRLEAFVADFESQFRITFHKNAKRHMFLRHARTPMNVGDLRFVGRTDIGICDTGSPGDENRRSFERVAEILNDSQLSPGRLFTSPLNRCRQTLTHIANRCDLIEQPVVASNHLVEIDYGTCEGLTISQAREKHPDLFGLWAQGEDPRFPDGECGKDVRRRLSSFLQESIEGSREDSVVCTHNVVLRTLVGDLLGVPEQLQYLIKIPHVMPLEVISTERFGLFLDLSAEVQEQLFASFEHSSVSKDSVSLRGRAA